MAAVERYAIVRNGVVENVCLWDGTPSWSPSGGAAAVKDSSSVAQISGGWDGTKFTAAPVVAAIPTKPTQQMRAGTFALAPTDTTKTVKFDVAFADGTSYALVFTPGLPATATVTKTASGFTLTLVAGITASIDYVAVAA